MPYETIDKLRSDLEMTRDPKKWIVEDAKDNGDGTYTVIVRDNTKAFESHMEEVRKTSHYKKFSEAFDAAMRKAEEEENA